MLKNPINTIQKKITYRSCTLKKKQEETKK